MNYIFKLRAAAVVLWLSLTGALGLHAQSTPNVHIAKCPPDTLGVTVSIAVEDSRNEPGVSVFTPLCDGSPCEVGKYIFEWKFDAHDYSVRQKPERSFASAERRNVRLTLTGIKESDDPDSRYGGCPPEIVASGGCTGIILPHCTRPTKTVEIEFFPKASQPKRHQEFGKHLALQNGDFAMLIAEHDGNPVPQQRSQYPLVLENRTACTTKVKTYIDAKVGGTDIPPVLNVTKGGTASHLRTQGGASRWVETILPPHATHVMLIEVKLPEDKKHKMLGKLLEIQARSEFTSECPEIRRQAVKATKTDLVQMAVDPSYLLLRTRHKITYGDRVRYRMVITNDGNLAPKTISILHELEPIWNRDKIKYTRFKINGHRLRKVKNGPDIKGGTYYLHDKNYSDSTVVIAIQPKEKEGHALVRGTQLTIDFKVRVDKRKPGNWVGNKPEPGVRLKGEELFVHHAYWTHFDNESVWYRSHSSPPTVIHPKSWKVWRWVKRGIAIGVPVAAYFLLR